MNKSIIGTLATLTASFWMLSPAQANEETGVSCPAGTQAEITNGNKKLKCSVQKTYRLDSICSPLTLTGPSSSVVMRPEGRDQCAPLIKGNVVNAQMAPPLPGYPSADRFVLVINPTGPDHFEAQVKEYHYPTGGPIYLGDKSKGVDCPAGYDGDAVGGGRGIRCDKQDGGLRAADCDFGWTLRRDDNGNQDRCLGINTGPTKPAGMTKVQLDLENALGSVKWKLHKNTGADQWERIVFAFPNSHN